MNSMVRKERPAGGKRYAVAMLVGTALSALGPSAALAAAPAADSARAVNDISRYCQACWRNAHLPPDCWTDCTQEVFCRLLDRMEPDSWERVFQAEGAERREFLRAIDTVKKRSQRTRRCSPLAGDGLADQHELKQRDLAEDRRDLDEVAETILSPRQERIVRMSLDGWSVQEIAQELNLPTARVSDEKYKAIRRLRERLS